MSTTTNNTLQGYTQTFSTELIEQNLAMLKYPSVGEELGFSYTPCWTCKRPLGGDRIALDYIGDNGDAYHEEICIDCALYIANGELPE